MPLPDSQHFSRKAGFQSVLTNQRPQRKTYAQVVVASAKVSLIHEPSKATVHPTSATLNTVQSRIYRAGRIKGAFLFDMSHVGEKYTDFQCLERIHQQHPGVYGATIEKEGAHRYVEAYILKADDNNDILVNGVIFEEEKVQILPNVAIQDKTQVVKIKLSNLPMFHPTIVKAGLTESLKVFGEILDVGIFTEPKLGLFMGTGFAVLNIDQAEDTPAEKKYAELSHQINWYESEEEVFHAVWSNMPTWCRYCHQEEHTKYECLQAKAKIICYSCHHQGHRSFECSRRNASNITNKKVDRKSYQAQEKLSLTKEGLSIQGQTRNKDNTDENTVSYDGNDNNSEAGSNQSLEGMDTDSSVSEVDEEEQMFRDQVVLCTDELEECAQAEKIQQTIQEMQQKNDITFTEESESAQESVGWKVVNRTPEAVAVVYWLNKHKYTTLLNSPSITLRRSSSPAHAVNQSHESTSTINNNC